MNDIITLRNFINNNDKINDETKIKSFCELMRNVSLKLEQEDKNPIRINIDEININIKTGEIILPEHLFSTANELDKTIAGFDTGISLVADRKSTKEHKRVSFALMILGWYVNPFGLAINSDMEVLENFDYYLSKVPNWLKDFFINVFRKMDYETSFDKYYDENFTNKIMSEIKVSFNEYNLTDEQLKRISNVIIKKANRKGGNNNE